MALFKDELKELYANGDIGFGEPDLVKVFSVFIANSRFKTVRAKTTLTQSRKKWFASLTKNGKTKEIGDLLLLTVNGTQIKYAFIQAKSIKSKDDYLNYSNKHNSFRANSYQHRLMNGSQEYIYVMGTKKSRDFYKPQYQSITNYLIFYRDSNFQYCADLSSVQGNTRLPKKSESHCANKEDKEITVQNKSVSNKNKRKTKESVFAIGFNRILEQIEKFNVGAINDGFLESIADYLPEVARDIVLNDDKQYRVFEPGVYDDDGSFCPVIIIDVSEGVLNLV